MTVLYNELNFTCTRQLSEMYQLLELYAKDKISNLACDYFGEVKRVGFNQKSGNVWLEDEDYNCLMINGDRLDLFISTPYNGIEGFLDDILNEYDLDDIHVEDKEYLLTLKKGEL